MKNWMLFSAFLSLAVLAQGQKKTQIAFLADVHLQVPFTELEGTDYLGIINPETGKPTLIRTMEAQLHSTRIFNENYFAFLAALEDLANRGIKLVALPGDYTDDGQPVHLRGLQKILEKYEQEYDMQFFITTGNHDPVRPFGTEAGKSDFLGKNGMEQSIVSHPDLAKPETNLPAIITQDIAKMGYDGVTSILQNFGFKPEQNQLFWTTPFAQYDVENYTFAKAKQAAELSNRMYEVAPGYTVPDVSYVVEPIDGIWLMAIDGDVFIPRDGAPEDGDNYGGASTGYNNVLTHKKHLIAWANKMAEMAKNNGKTLIAFSHFPMLDFNDNASAEIEQLMGKNKWQLERVPDAEVAKAFADAGIKIHFAGHMHINDSNITTSGNNTLLNVQVPSLAAYPAAYKLLTIDGQKLEIETVEVNTKAFTEHFPLYEMEYEYLKNTAPEKLWNHEILNTEDYAAFTQFHLKELVRLRFIPQDWPEELSSFLAQANAQDILKKINGKQSKLLSSWQGSDLIEDFHKIRSADVLAFDDIPKSRIHDYKLLIKASAKSEKESQDVVKMQLQLMLKILDKFMHGTPADHFIYNLKTGKIRQK
ncbi:MAG: metallophosphatase [Cytophagaceae bacterium]|nr:metallophosphatase [Cytophagaceae bacterium]|tara:strand:- start:381 stop:2150 length:1770 start_codon:yes stop_codon:yes gene_type:complete